MNKVIYMKKSLSLCLLAALLLVGCGKTETIETTVDTTTVAETETIETELTDNVPELDFGGTEFRIMTGIHSTYPVSTYSAEQTGEALSDALYQRNLVLAERFNIVFNENVSADIFDVNDKVREMALAGDNAYEMMMQIDRFALAAGMEGSLLSYDKLPYVDLSKPWWNQNAQKDFSVNGKLFFTYGDDNLVFFGSTTVLVFNKELVKNYTLDDPYQLVYDGKWTYDKFMEMNETVTADLDGDGKMTVDDQWGTVLTSNSFYPNFWLQSGYKLVEKDGDDLPYFNVPGNDGLISLMLEIAADNKKEFWYNLDLKSDYKGKFTENHNYNNVMLIFSEGRSLFASSSLINIMDARDMEMDFGILPYPANEEKGAGYIYGSRTFGGFPYVVPITVQDTEMVSAVMEAVACESHKTIIPVLYDKVLKGKNTRDEDSGRIMDMIRQNRITDLAETYWFDSVEYPYETEMRTASEKIASKTASMQDKVQADLDKAIAFFKDME